MDCSSNDGSSNSRNSDYAASSSSTDPLDVMDCVTESLHDNFVSDSDDASLGLGRMSAMSAEDDGSSFILSQSFAGSTVTELSSVFSMSEDDFDKMASRHARLLFDDIDSMLFEHHSSGPLHLLKECLDWQTRFPHLRVLGHRVMDDVEEGFRLYPAMSAAMTSLEDINVLSASNDLLVQGKHFDVIHPGLCPSGSTEGSSLVNVEEVLEENGTMEDIFAIDYRIGDEDFQKSGRRYSTGHPPVTPFNCVKDTVVSTLFNHVLLQVVSTVRPLLDRVLETTFDRKVPESGMESTDNLELSMNSMNCLEKNSRSMAFANSILSSVPEDTALESLLTIRSKALLSRERTLGILDGLTETLHSQTFPSVRLNPGLFGNGHPNERRSSLNRIKLLPLENARLQSLVPPGEVDPVASANLDGLRGHRLGAISCQNSTAPIPKLPPLQSQRTVMSANFPNAIINRPMQSNKRISQRAISAIQEKDVKVPYREKDRSSMTLDARPTTTQTQYSTEKRQNDNGQSVGRQSAASLLPLNIAHRPSTALSAKPAIRPSLVLSGSGITARKTEKSEYGGSRSTSVAAGQLNLARRTSGPFDDIIQMASRWNPIHLTRDKIYKNLQGGSTLPSGHSRLLQLRPSQPKATVS